MTRPRVTLVAQVDSPFVQRDRQVLKESFVLRDVRWRGKRSIPALAWAVLRSDVTFAWFALDHAYAACRLAEMFNKKSIVVVGGVDAAKRPEWGYGVHLSPKMGPRSRYALAHTSRVLVVDDFLREEIARNTDISRPEILTVHLGFDTQIFRPDDRPKETVLTVGIVNDVNLERKGLCTFVDAAREAPDLPFVLVGARDNDATAQLRTIAPSNLRLLGHLSDAELLEQYRRARVYVQISLYEGLPTALGEAMACACVPVGTRVAGIPTLIGDVGYYVPERDPQATAKAIQQAYAEGHGTQARRRIEERFSSEMRSQTLRRIVAELAGTPTSPEG